MKQYSSNQSITVPRPSRPLWLRVREEETLSLCGPEGRRNREACVCPVMTNALIDMKKALFADTDLADSCGVRSVLDQERRDLRVSAVRSSVQRRVIILYKGQKRY